MPSILEDINLPTFLNAPANVRPAPRGNPGRPYRLTDVQARAVRDFLPTIFGSGLNQAVTAAPYLAAGNIDLLTNYLPRLAAAETEANRIGQLGQARTSADVLAGPGRDIVGGLKGLDIFADPEYYEARAGIGGKISDLVGGLNPNELSGGELANIERAVNRSNVGRGTANTGSPTETIRSAMVFGDRLQNKQNQVANILSQVSSALPALKTNLVNFGQATGVGGAGAGQGFLPSTSETAQNAFGLTSNLLGQTTNLTTNERQLQANKIPGWQQIIGSLPDYS